MNATVQSVAWSVFVGGYFEQLLKTIFCSSAWLKTSVTKTKTENGLMACISNQTYPPGGATRTGMIRCQECRRWAPRHKDILRLPEVPSSLERICPDCAVEAEEDLWAQRLEHYSDKSFGWELLKLSWRTASTIHRIEQGEDEYSDTWQEYSDETGKVEYGYQKVGPVFWDSFQKHRRWVGKGSRVRLQSHNLLDEIPEMDTPEPACNLSLRSLGCQCTLLAESKAALQKEIAYYQEHREIIPSAIRGRIEPI